MFVNDQYIMFNYVEFLGYVFVIESYFVVKNEI